MFRLLKAIYNGVAHKQTHTTPEVKKPHTDTTPKQKIEIGHGKKHWPLGV